jgi:DNA helicase IV
MNTKQILDLEKQNLKSSQENISKELNGLSTIIKEIEDKYTEDLKSVAPTANENREEILKDLIDYLTEKNYSYKSGQISELQYQVQTPYFARVQFISNGLKSAKYDIYIGRYSFMQNGLNPPIVDWRSPAAALFYNYLGSNKKATFSFETKNSDRKQILNKDEGELILRRHLIIEQGELKKFFDTSDGIHFLAETLEAKTGGVLDTIIESIQAEQDVIIRSPFNIPILVQGTAGSGKTTIAIHKISYLLFTQSDTLKENNLLLLLNSPTLIKYVRSTLRDLDINDPHIYSLKNILVKKLKLFHGGYSLRWYQVKNENYVGDYNLVIDEISEFCLGYSFTILAKVKSVLNSRRIENFNFEMDKSYYLYFMYIFANELWGDSAMPSPKYKYILVDEGQDYSNLEYEVICRLSIDCKLSIFGDLNQQVDFIVHESWDDVVKILNKHSPFSTTVYNLNTSFRNTKQITCLNSKILKGFSNDNYLPQPFERNGNEPIVKSLLNEEEMYGTFISDLKDLLVANSKSVCIVGLDEEQIPKLKALLSSNNVEAIIIDDKLFEFEPDKIYLSHASKIKGLEFSSVFILKWNSTSPTHGKISVNQFYVLCSRAINEVRIYHCGDSSLPFII